MSQTLPPSPLPAPHASPADTSLHGRWLLIARVAWVVLTLFLLTLNVVMLPAYDALLQAPCQPGAMCLALQLTEYDHQFLQQTGLSLGFLAGYEAALNAISIAVCFALAGLLFWRKSADRMALFCAFMLVLLSGVGLSDILIDTLAVTSFAWFLVIGIFDLLGQSGFLIFFLLFPSGRFVPRWTRWLALFTIFYWVYYIFIARVIYDENLSPGGLLFFALILFVVGTQVYRYRRVSTPRERQQTRWVVFGIAVGLVGFALLILLGNFLLPPALLQSSVLTTFVAGTGTTGFLMLIPASIVIAILRSRLWDIDTIINRALVYGSLTALLGALYAGLIVGLTSLAGVIGGETAQEPVVIVISTLAIAALFQPARKRLQAAIDRRFYRSKYDAARTLESFSATLRQEVDLNDLREHLLAVVAETMQPAQVSLWLRSPDKKREQGEQDRRSV